LGKLKIDKATCSRVLHDDLHLKKVNLCHVPHSPEADQNGRGSNYPENFFRHSNKISNMSLNIYYQGTKAGSFGIFHHSCWAANLDDLPEIPK
jgi:hypothetical protein